MDPATILALISAAMPLLEQMLQMGVLIAQQVAAAQAAQTAAPSAGASSLVNGLIALQTQHATTVATAVKAVSAVAAAK